MTWLLVLAMAVATFVIAAFVLRMPRAGWALFGAALMLGMAGYALQGSPAQEGAPRSATPEATPEGAAMVEERRALFDPDFPPSRFVVTADGFSRRGQYAEAAEFARGAVEENPEDTEAWLALGNALVEHADGQLTPAALYAFSEAERTDPEHPGASYFLGLAFLRSGRPNEARDLWRELVERAPDDAGWKPLMEERLARLDAMLGRIGGVDPQAPLAPSP